MKTIKTLLVAICAAVSMMACTNNDKHEEIKTAVEQMQKQMPIRVPGTTMWITKAELKADILMYTYGMTREEWNEMAVNESMMQSDRNKARTMANLGDKVCQTLIDAKLGFGATYVEKETNDVFAVLSVGAEEFAEIYKKMQTGEIEPYSVMEMMNEELAGMELPMQVDEGVWLTSAAVRDNAIFYDYTIDSDDELEVFGEDLENEIKTSLIDELVKQNPIRICKKQMLREGIRFVYTYSDSFDNVLCVIEITAEELFAGTSDEVLLGDRR